MQPVFIGAGIGVDIDRRRVLRDVGIVGTPAGDRFARTHGTQRTHVVGPWLLGDRGHHHRHRRIATTLRTLGGIAITTCSKQACNTDSQDGKNSRQHGRTRQGDPRF